MADQMIINARREKGTISRMIYGHFAEHLGRCIYDGIYVGENSGIENIRGMRLDIIQALKKIRIPVLRWPGGCFADEYHWRNGIGEKALRPGMVNTHWGGVTENNHFGTHEFFDLCELLECEPYICGNVGSGSVQEMAEWVEYMTSGASTPLSALREKNGRKEPWKLSYFGIGNENWGCGGHMRAEYYADVYCRYALYARDYGDNHLIRVAAGPRGANEHWTEVLMRDAGMYMDAIGLHYYTRVGDKTTVVRLPDGNERYLPDPSGNRHSATEFDEEDWFGIMKAAVFTDELIRRHSAIMDKYDPQKRVGLYVDEWGTWYEEEPGTPPGFLYQQNTIRDAVSAAVSLNCFNNHCDRVRMANIAQTVNVLQAMLLTEGDRLVRTPTYHVFDLFQVHQDAVLLESALLCGDYQWNGQKIPRISASVSKDAEGKIHITFANADPGNDADIVCYFGDVRRLLRAEGTVLRADRMNSCNTFEEPERVCPQRYEGIMIDAERLRIRIPAGSVLLVTVEAELA